MTILVIAAFVLLGASIGLAVVFMSHLAYAQRNVVPFVVAPKAALSEIVTALKLPESGAFFDLGCGDGRVLGAVRRAAPGLKLVGIENNPVPLSVARLKLGGAAKLIGGDILKQDLKKADRVFAYLGPGLMAQLEEKFETELRAGTRVVSMQFPMPNRKAVEVLELKYGEAHAKRLYVYDY